MLNNRWLVLVGGGGKGPWQAGAIDSLHKAGLLDGLTGIVGTSVGGLNACALGVGLAQGLGTKVLLDAWAHVTKDEDIYKPSITAVQQNPWWHWSDVLGLAKGFLFGRAACSTDPLEGFLRNFLDGWSTERITAAGGPKVFVRALCYNHQRPETLCGDLVPMALATSAIEGVFPRRWGYGDGGAVDNEPVSVALANGAKQILVVFCAPEDPETAGKQSPTVLRDGSDSSKTTGLDDAKAVLGSLVALGEARASEEAERAEADGVQVVYCFPPSDTGSSLDFAPRGLLERGRTEAAKAIEDAKNLDW